MNTTINPSENKMAEPSVCEEIDHLVASLDTPEFAIENEGELKFFLVRHPDLIQAIPLVISAIKRVFGQVGKIVIRAVPEPYYHHLVLAPHLEKWPEKMMDAVLQVYASLGFSEERLSAAIEIFPETI